MSFKPYEDEDVAAVLTRLINDRELLDMMSRWRMPLLSALFPFIAAKLASRQLKAQFGNVTSVRGFQNAVARYVRHLVSSSTDDFTVSGLEQLDPEKGYLFVSNHRDIAGDSMLLNFALYEAGLNTVNIAVGDNLVQKSFATDIMKLNKSFFINRTGTNTREIYRSLAEVSSYIRSSVEGGHSVWIAQSEGRAKDGLDRTDTAVLKMLLLSDRKRAVSESLGDLRLVPVSLAYEYDPCDSAKARELSIRQKEGSYKKQSGEDLESLVTGLTGYKGRVHMNIGAPLAVVDEEVAVVATQLDQAILGALRLYPINYWALAQMDPDRFAQLGGNESLFAGAAPLLKRRLEQCPPEYQPDWLRIYANPVLNVADVLGEDTAMMPA